MKPFRKSMLIACLLVTFEVLVEVTHPLLLAKLIDEGILKQDFSAIWLWGSAMVVVALLGFISGISNTFFSAHVSHGFGAKLRQELFEKGINASLRQTQSLDSSAWSTRLTNDVNQIQQALFFSLRMVLRAPLVILVSLILACILDIHLAIWLLVFTPTILMLLYGVVRLGFRLFGQAQTAIERLNFVLKENILGMLTIRSFVQENKEYEKFSKLNEGLLARMKAALRVSEMTIPGAVLVMNLVVVMIIATAHERILNETLAIGVALAVVQYAMRIAGSFSYISMIITTMSRARASWIRIKQISNAVNIDLNVTDHTNEEQTHSLLSSHNKRENIKMNKRLSVHFNQVAYYYNLNREPALHPFSLTINAGERIAIMGGTGSGKTTLLHCLVHLLEPQGGHITLYDEDGSWIPPQEINGLVSFVPQENILFSGTIRENLLWGNPSATENQMIEAAKIAGIHDTILQFPLQYSTYIENRGKSLSGGQRQRLALARALIKPSGLLILDDSTSALDVSTEQKILASLHKVLSTQIFVTQKVSIAQIADRILLLDGGKLVDQGTHMQLIERNAIYKKIMSSQQKEEKIFG